jgi:hypothetical protein
MTVPLDRLYHYIESVAQDIRGDAVIIYRFFPHGSKKLTDLQQLHKHDFHTIGIKPHIYCNDQEPLDYNFYQTINVLDHPDITPGRKLTASLGLDDSQRNFYLIQGIFDKALLLHSEQRSQNVNKYKENVFILVYYWCHAVIALDWFRYAQHVKQKKQIIKKFLIYNRAWSGTREYRLKFVDLLVQYNLHNSCRIGFNQIEPELNISYHDYTFKNTAWKPINQLENYYQSNTTPSHASADFDLIDYESTEFEIVLETLFDDDRLHLTEKTLRPIATGQPFLLVATHGSLVYLKKYGFKTFESVFDESYDTIEDPVARLDAVVKLMKAINEWTADEHKERMLKISEIVKYNRDYFFSDEFFDLIIAELKDNLTAAFQEQEDTNTGSIIDWRKKLSAFPEGRNRLLGNFGGVSRRQQIAEFVAQARKYYTRNKH